MDTTGTLGTLMRVRSGRYLDLADPKPDQFTFEDIAHALSKEQRWSNQLDRPYSVAEHCVHCLAYYQRGWTLPSDFHAEILMHDAHEAFTRDLALPIRMTYNESRITTFLDIAICMKFDLRAGIDVNQLTHICDKAILFAEKRLFFPNDPKWEGESLYTDWKLTPYYWEPAQAKHEFTFIAKTLGINTEI